ncbi:hypothetical protein GQ457_12G011660 [Hibiscus cannabinus]
MGSFVDPLLDPSGRPPDPMVRLESPVVLERLGSPTALEDQRNSKKIKGCDTEQDGIVIGEQDMVMATEVEAGSDESREPDSTVDGGTSQQGVPAIGKISYASVVAQGQERTGTDMGEDVLDPNNVVVLDEDCVIYNYGDYPSIKFSTRVHDQIDRSMRNVVIVRLLGRNIGYGTLLNRLHALWKPKWEIQLINLENNYFLVRLEDMRDYEVVLIEGPWTIFGNYLTVHPWSRSFNTDEKHPSQVIVWVRLPGLPYRYYYKALFRHIAQVVGKVVKVDYNTQAGERGKFARLAITVDLNKPLTPCIGIDNFVQKLEYEGLNQICFTCGKYGHSREGCNLNPVPNVEAANAEVVNQNTVRVPNKSELYGPWMVVKDRRRMAVLSKNSDRNLTDVGGEANGSRFAVLGEAQDGDQMAVDGVTHNQDMNDSLPLAGLGETVSAGLVGASTAQAKEAESGTYRALSPAHRSRITGNMLSMDTPFDEISGKEKGTRLEDRHIGHGKGIREVNPKGVRIRKSVGVSSPSRVLISDWVQTTSQQLEAEVVSNRGKGASGSVTKEDGREAVLLRQAPRTDAPSLGDANCVPMCRETGGDNGDLPM